MKTHCNCNQVDEQRKKTKSKLRYESGSVCLWGSNLHIPFILKPAPMGGPVQRTHPGPVD